MRSLRFSWCFCLLNVFAFGQNQLLKVHLENSLSLNRSDQSVEIPKNDLSKIKDRVFTIRDQSTHEEIPYQWLFDGNLLIQIDFKPNEKKELVFLAEKPSDFKAEVYGRYVPERYDDFAWENDLIAFRMYGKALEKVPNQNAWGLDVWAKRTHKFVLNEWYRLDNYHHDNGDGLDFFHVGSSLGGGDVLPIQNGDFMYLGNYTEYRILDSGPLRFTFELLYPSVNKDGIQITTRKKISLDAHSQFNKMEVQYDVVGKPALEVFSGIVHWNGKGEGTIGSKGTFAIYWEPETENGTIGIAIVYPKQEKIGNFKEHFGAKTSLKSGQTFTFYSGAAWSKAGVINDSAAWQQYVFDYSKKIASPIKVNLNN